MLFILDKDNLGALEMSGNMTIGFLAHAEDILILSKTAVGLQKALKVLEKFCDSWEMTVNKNKIKYITFQQKNKVNRKGNFCFNGKILVNVGDFVYLGL